MNSNIINQSNLISRDLSWLNFNYRVLDQVKDKNRGVLDKLKFLSIVSSNFDEFFEIRVGSLYNYIDNNKKRIDYSGMREEPFREFLLEQCSKFFNDFNSYFSDTIISELNEKKIFIGNLDNLDEEGQKRAKKYFKKTIFLAMQCFNNLYVKRYFSSAFLSLCFLNRCHRSNNLFIKI